MTPGWRWIAVEGHEIWAYVGAGRIEAQAAPVGVPIHATIDGVVYAIQATRIGAATFEADIIGAVSAPTPTAQIGASFLPKAPHLNEDDHDE